MNKAPNRLAVIALPFLLVGTLQLAGCVSKKLPPPPPGGVYRSTSSGAQFDQSVSLVDDAGTPIGNIAELPFLTIHRSPTDPAVLYAAAYQQGIVTSRDDGLTWQRINQPLASATSIAVLSNGVILVTGTNADREGLVTRSLDGGRSWEEVLTIPAFKKRQSNLPFEVIKPPPPPSVFVTSVKQDPFQGDRVYAATSTGELLAGEQSGKVWQSLVTTSPIKNISTSPHQEGEVLLVTTDGQLIRSLNGASEPLKLPERTKAQSAIYIQQFPAAILLGTDKGAYISRDRGDSWLELPLPISTVSPLRSVVVRVSPTNPNRFLISVDSVVYRSEDGGENWNTYSLGLPNHLITDISIDPTNAARVLLVTAPLPT